MRYSSSSASLTPATTSVADDLGNYNAVGLATQYTVEVNTDTTAAYNYTNTYKYDYVGFGGSYREARQQASITLPGYTAGTTTTTFDSHGNAIQIDNPNGEPKSQRLIVDAQGRILHKDVTKKDNSVVHQDYAYVNGNPIGSNGDAESSTYDYNYTPISDQYPASNPGQYIVQSSSETLQGIAQSVFGDANLWYLIADANGLSAGATLVAGQALTIPNQVSNLHNDANTFRPYQPNEIIGDTTAAVKAPPPPSHKSNIFATILIAVVVVVATVFTAGAAAVALGAVAGTTLGTASLATIAGAGIAAASGAAGSIGVAVAAAAIGGAVGSAVGQAVGIGLGVQHGFSFSQVAIGGLTAAATAGIGAGIGEVAKGTALAATSGPGAFARGALTGALNSASSQGINIALGQQKSFSFAGVAASAITSGIGSSLGENDPLRRIPGSNNPGLSFSGVAAASLRNTAYGVLNRSITVALEGHGKINVANIAADGFGNALGNAIVGEIQLAGLPKEVRNLDARDRAEYSRLAQQLGQDSNGASANPTLLKIIASRRGEVDPAEQASLVSDFLSQKGADEEQIASVLKTLRQNYILPLDTDVSAAERSAPDNQSTGTSDLGRISIDGNFTGPGGSFGQDLDALQIGAGRIFESVGVAIEDNPLAKYTLIGLDIASGPALYALRETISASPIGEFQRGLEDRAANFFAARLEDKGFDREESRVGAGGAVGILNIAAGGLAVAVKSFGSVLRRLRSESTEQASREALRAYRATVDDEFGRVPNRLLDRLIDRPSASVFGTLPDGRNQGIRHLIDYAALEPRRLSSLEERLGLNPGTFSLNERGFDEFVNQAERVVKEGKPLKFSDDKVAYFLEGVESANKGVIVITFQDKLQTLYPATYKQFLKTK
ncbi:MAG: hypothetical protein M0Q15_01850 [Nevskia sp.]|nr:hypothetical protein [Nevskia sp.]